MELTTKTDCRKIEYQKISFELKLSIIDEINNGLISANFAAKKYNISRGTSPIGGKNLATTKAIKNQ